jgi:cellulose synthase operon protein YhjQ
LTQFRKIKNKDVFLTPAVSRVSHYVLPPLAKSRSPMTVSSDISNLFKQFGGSPEHYQELSKAGEARVVSKPTLGVQINSLSSATSEASEQLLPEQPAAAPALVDDAPTPAAVVDDAPTPSAVVDDAPTPSAVVDDAPTPSAVVDDSAWAKGSLQRLLAQLAHEERRDMAERVVEPTAAVAPELDHLQILALVSANGGVGKSTLAANLAVAARAQGRPVVALDLAPQDALQHHFSWDAGALREDVSGIASANGNWAQTGIRTRSGVVLLPFGQIDEARRLELEAQLKRDPLWLARQLAALELPEGALVIVDTPPGPSPYLRQALAVASMTLVVCKADAASYNALAQITGLIQALTAERGEAAGSAGYLINQREADCPLDRNIGRVLEELLGEQILGNVRRDPGIGEALVYNLSALEHVSAAAGSEDLRRVSETVLARLSSYVQVEQLP